MMMRHFMPLPAALFLHGMDPTMLFFFKSL
jgi:hypothetical protein